MTSVDFWILYAFQNAYSTRNCKIHSKAKLQKSWEMWVCKSMQEPFSEALSLITVKKHQIDVTFKIKKHESIPQPKEQVI